MKKMMLFFAGMLFMGVTATFAQTDTTGTQRKEAIQTPTDRQDDQNRNYTKDMVKIQQAELPDNLRTALQAPQYKGWESGTVYRTKTSDGYLIEMKDGSKTKTYRFDANGKPLQDH